MSEEIEKRAGELGKQVLNEVQTFLGGDWLTLTDEQQESVARASVKVMELELRQQAGENVAEKLQAVRSTIQDWKVWGELAVEEAFWKGVQKVASAIGTFLASFATEAIKRIVPGV